MKPLMIFRNVLISRKGILVLLLFFLLFKLFFVGYFATKSRRLSDIPFLSQAVAQEESTEAESVGISDVTVSEEDFKYLNLLEKKRKELENKEEDFKQKEEWLNQLKAEIEERLDKLAQMEKKIGQLIVLKESKEDKELTKLAKVFEATPPEQAGPMFNKLDVGLAAKILLRMKGRNAGKIWGYVNPEQAVRISRELSNLK